jgi:acyl-CoA thioester hydrolase
MNLEEKLTEFKYKISIPIRFSDMDMFGHVNNAIYLTYFEQARVAYWKEIIKWDWKKMGIIIAKSEVEYLKPIFPEDQIYAYLRTSKIGRSSFNIEYLLVAEQNGNQILKTTGRTTQVTFDYTANKPASIPEKQKLIMIEFDHPEQ